jgi:CheY-like chemotaxis protein
MTSPDGNATRFDSQFAGFSASGFQQIGNHRLQLVGAAQNCTQMFLALVPRRLSHESSRKLRILVAEDNAVNQAVIMSVLQKMGHSSLLAHNGKQALLLATSEKFDVLFMDVQMPEMDGLAATGAIREAEQITQTHLPIIAMTAHAMKGDRERCLQAGMDGYISKPLRFSDIEDALANLDCPPHVVTQSPTLPAGARRKRSIGLAVMRICCGSFAKSIWRNHPNSWKNCERLWPLVTPRQ